MDQQTLLTVMTAFVIIAAVALIIQAAMLAGIYKTSRGLQQNVQRLMPKIESVLETSRQTIEDSRKQIADITSKTSEILETTRKQMQRVDEFMEDATSRARVQMDRAEMVLDDAMGALSAPWHWSRAASSSRSCRFRASRRASRRPSRFCCAAAPTRPTPTPTKRCLFRRHVHPLTIHYDN